MGRVKEQRSSHLEARFDFQCKALNLPVAVKEFKFHPTRKWRVDRAWPNLKICVEIEGGVYSGGRHVRGKGFESDCDKYNECIRLGYRLFRFTSKHVTSGKAVNYIESVINEVMHDTV